MAPEVIKGKSYCESADVFSAGIIAWELLTENALSKVRVNEIVQQVVTYNVRPEIPPFLQSSAPQMEYFLKAVGTKRQRRELLPRGIKAIELSDTLLTNLLED